MVPSNIFILILFYQSFYKTLKNLVVCSVLLNGLPIVKAPVLVFGIASKQILNLTRELNSNIFCGLNIWGPFLASFFFDSDCRCIYFIKLQSLLKPVLKHVKALNKCFYSRKFTCVVYVTKIKLISHRNICPILYSRQFLLNFNKTNF